MTSGVRLRFRTTAQAIELDIATTQISFVGADRIDPAFSLRVDCEFVDDLRAAGGTVVLVSPDQGDIQFVPGAPAMIRFENLNAEGKDCEIWLPPDCSVEVQALRVSDGATIEPFATKQPRWTHYGSSISHCMDVDSPQKIWPVIAGGIGGLDRLHLGFAGQCQLDPFMGRVIGDAPADFISLKLGINLVNAASMTQGDQYGRAYLGRHSGHVGDDREAAQRRRRRSPSLPRWAFVVWRKRSAGSLQPTASEPVGVSQDRRTVRRNGVRFGGPFPHEVTSAPIGFAGGNRRW